MYARSMRGASLRTLARQAGAGQASSRQFSSNIMSRIRRVGSERRMRRKMLSVEGHGSENRGDLVRKVPVLQCRTPSACSDVCSLKLLGTDKYRDLSNPVPTRPLPDSKLHAISLGRGSSVQVWASQPQ